MVSSRWLDFFPGPPDRCERLLSSLQYCITSRDLIRPTADELFEILGKGTNYRGMIDFNRTNESSLSKQIEAVLDKFSELRHKLLMINVPIDVSRGSMAESNQAWAGLMRRITKISNRGRISLHALTSIDEDIVVASFHPNSVRGEPIRQSLLHISSDVHLYDDTSAKELSVMMDSLLVKNGEDGSVSVRTHRGESRGDSESADEISSRPTTFTAVLLLDVTSITTLATNSSLLSDEVDEFVENVVELTSAAVFELRRDEKLATIKSMQQLVITLENAIQVELQHSELSPISPASSVETAPQVVPGCTAAGSLCDADADEDGIYFQEDAVHPVLRVERASLTQSSSSLKSMQPDKHAIAFSSERLSTPRLDSTFNESAAAMRSRGSDAHDGPRTGESMTELSFYRSSKDDKNNVSTSLDSRDDSSSRWSLALLEANAAAISAMTNPLMLDSEDSNDDSKHASRECSEHLSDERTAYPSQAGVAEVLVKAIAHAADSPIRTGASSHHFADKDLVSSTAMQKLLESQGSEDIAAYGLRAYQAIRDDILAEVVSTLRDSTLLSSSISRSRLADEKASSYADKKAERKFSPSSKKVSVRQSGTFRQAKSVEQSRRPGTAPAAASFKEKPRPFGKKSSSAKSSKMNKSVDSRGSLSSLSSMGSPPRTRPTTPMMADRSMSMSMSIEWPSTQSSKNAAHDQHTTASSSPSKACRLPGSSTPLSEKSRSTAVGTSITPTASPTKMRECDSFRPGTAASAASRDRGVSRAAAMRHDLLGYDTGVSPPQSPLLRRRCPQKSATVPALNAKSSSFDSRRSDRVLLEKTADSVMAAVRVLPSPSKSLEQVDQRGSPVVLPKVHRFEDEDFYDLDDGDDESGQSAAGSRDDGDFYGGDNSEAEANAEDEGIFTAEPDCVADFYATTEPEDDVNMVDEPESEKGEEDEEDGDEDPEWRNDCEALFRDYQELELEVNGEEFGIEGKGARDHEDVDGDDGDEGGNELHGDTSGEAANEIAHFDPWAVDGSSNKSEEDPDQHDQEDDTHIGGDEAQEGYYYDNSDPAELDLPDKVFEPSALHQLKAQLEATRAEIESSRQKKDMEGLESRRHTAEHVLRALETKSDVSRAPPVPARRVEFADMSAPVVATPPPAVASQPNIKPRQGNFHENNKSQLAIRANSTDRVNLLNVNAGSDSPGIEQRKARFLQEAESRALAREIKRNEHSAVTYEDRSRAGGAAPHQPHPRARSSTNKLSNQQLIKNAISNVCLAGAHFEAQRVEAIQSIDYWHTGEGAEARRKSIGDAVVASPTASVAQFIILFFHSKSLSFRGLYAVDPYTGAIHKIFGRGPKSLPVLCIEDYFKYESSSRSFKKLPVKSLSSTVDAVSVDPSQLKKR